MDSTLREQLIEPFSAAVRQALLDMASVEANVRSAEVLPELAPPGELAVCVMLTGALDGLFVLSCRRSMAEALARRTLGDAVTEVTPELIVDCLGEIANVVAGQAKALLAAGPYHFIFSTPTAFTEREQQTGKDLQAFGVAFDTDIGEIVLQLARKQEPRAE